MPLTPDLRRGIDRIRDHLYGGGYPNPAQNAEQLSFLIFFYMFEAADAARVRAARRPGAEVWDYDLDSHPFAGLGGYDQAARIFGGRNALDLVLGSLNVAVFDDNGPHLPARADERAAIQDSSDPCH